MKYGHLDQKIAAKRVVAKFGLFWACWVHRGGIDVQNSGCGGVAGASRPMALLLVALDVLKASNRPVLV